MMDNLFALYRWLVQNQSKDTDNPYNEALRTLEPVLNLLSLLEHDYGDQIKHNNQLWGSVSSLTDEIVQHHKNALCEHFASSFEAIVDFCSSDLKLEDIDSLIEKLQQQKEQMQALALEDSLGDLDDHPF